MMNFLKIYMYIVHTKTRYVTSVDKQKKRQIYVIDRDIKRI